jgi:hypothetical protein
VRLKTVRLHRTTVVPGIGTVRDEIPAGGEVVGPWVRVETPTGAVLIWGADVAPSEVDAGADAVRSGPEAPARGRARPPGAEG